MEIKMKNAFLSLLNQLEVISDEFNEVTDTYVRDQMREAITRAFFKPDPGYILPDEYGMFSVEGNAKVKVVLSQFIVAARIEAEQNGLSTPVDRLDAFQNIEAQSCRGNTYDEYFGHADGI
jgi:hypothetical protein